MIGPLLVDYAGAATILGLDSPNWLQENIRNLPHTRLGKYVRFSEQNLVDIVRLHLVQPALVPTEAPTVAPGLLELTPGRAPRAKKRLQPTG